MSVWCDKLLVTERERERERVDETKRRRDHGIFTHSTTIYQWMLQPLTCGIVTHCILTRAKSCYFKM
jgi:hypothetical protein